MSQRIACLVCLLICLYVFQAQLFAQTSKKIAQTAYSVNPQTIAAGKQLFQQNCLVCHNFYQKGMGPNLATVTSEASAQWIKSFIHNAPSVIARGDARAKRLFDEFKQPMPSFQHLKSSDVDALLAYIHSQQRKQTNDSDKDLGPSTQNPIAAGIASAGLRVDLTEVMTAPATSQKIPLARIYKMDVMPGPDRRLFLQDMRGTLYEVIDGNSLREFMSMPKERPNFINEPGLATGLGSYAFHPDFQKNGLLYTTHTEKAKTAPADFAYADSIRVSLQWVLTEWKLTDPNAKTFSGTGRELLRVDMVSQIHGVQEVTFNPHAKVGSPDYGMLYIGIGDGGSAENKAYFLCKDPNRVWGKVLRIDPKGTNSKNSHYGIPSDNPFAKSADPHTLREVFCSGFRNPNRIIWTPDGTMLISDIGQAQIEEINVGVAGANYGWPEREGTFLINHEGQMDRVYALPANDSGYTYPAVQYDHTEGNAIAAGFVYTGSAVPALQGKYIFGDVVNGRVFCVEANSLRPGKQTDMEELMIRVDGKNTTFQELTKHPKTDLRFGVGNNGDFYMFTKTDGRIYKITGSSPE